MNANHKGEYEEVVNGSAFVFVPFHSGLQPIEQRDHERNSFGSVQCTDSGSDGHSFERTTGIQTNSVTNESGVYNMPGLLPGVYRVSASLPGFQTQTYTDVQLGNAAQVRLNFTLKVAAATTVDVTIAADTLLATSSSSVGEVLTQQKVSDLPLVGNDVLDLILVMNGVEGITGNAFGQEGTTFAGISAREINIQRDGISVNESRFPTGVRSATRLNPDLVGEIRLILAPVDVEMGRGNAQIQVSTRSGTNRYSGSAFV